MSVNQGSEAILEALKLACSQNPEELKKGEEKLKNWEREAGFYSELAVSAVCMLGFNSAQHCCASTTKCAATTHQVDFVKEGDCSCMPASVITVRHGSDVT